MRSFWLRLTKWGQWWEHPQCKLLLFCFRVCSCFLPEMPSAFHLALGKHLGIFWSLKRKILPLGSVSYHARELGAPCPGSHGRAWPPAQETQVPGFPTGLWAPPGQGPSFCHPQNLTFPWQVTSA